MIKLYSLPQPQAHDFTFSTTYSHAVCAHDLVQLANKYGLQHSFKPHQGPQSARLYIQAQSLKLDNSVLKGLKSKKIADLVYRAQLDGSQFSASIDLTSLWLTLLFEHKFIPGPQTLWQMLEYTMLLRQSGFSNIVPILVVQSGTLPSSLLSDKGRELVGLGLIEFPCFILYLPDIPDEALLDPNLTSGGILFIMKKYEDIKKDTPAGRVAVQKVVRYFRNLPEERQKSLLGIGWQYLFSLNSGLDEVAMGKIERDIIKPGEEVILTPKLQTWEEIWTEQALQQGMQQGRIEEKRALVQRMLRVRIDKSQIQEVSGLSNDEIDKIALKS